MPLLRENLLQRKKISAIKTQAMIIRASGIYVGV